MKAMKAGAHDYVMKDNLQRLTPVIEREVREATTRRTRRKVEAELQKVEQRLELAVEGANIGIWDYTISTGTVVYDRRWAQMLGYTVEELEPVFHTWERLCPSRRFITDAAGMDNARERKLARPTKASLACAPRPVAGTGCSPWKSSRTGCQWSPSARHWHPSRYHRA